MVSPNYMTLSYRWASNPTLQLTVLNFKQLRKGKPVDDLPKTFRDAITVAHRFSVRYLWVDSLCILQDSPEDFERESSTMRDVYTNSCCNISATASSDPSGGLFRRGKREGLQPGLVVTRTDFVQNKYYILDRSYWDRQIEETVLNQRGWVLQERLLAPRVLHFAEGQIFWECFTQQKCQVFPLKIPLRKPLKSLESLFYVPGLKESLLHPSAFDFWREVAQTYTKCDLTRPGDKLIALSGLAHLFQERTGDHYLAGL
jgi:Heterokaryon incompatibility protein (HET)